MTRLSDYDDQLNSQRQLDEDRRVSRDSLREPIVSLRRLTADDHRERTAINLGSTFVGPADAEEIAYRDATDDHATSGGES